MTRVGDYWAGFSAEPSRRSLMDILPNVVRLRQIKTEGFNKGDKIIFCPDCSFQYSPNTVGKMECPFCKTRLHITTVDSELLRIANED